MKLPTILLTVLPLIGCNPITPSIPESYSVSVTYIKSSPIQYPNFIAYQLEEGYIGVYSIPSDTDQVTISFTLSSPDTLILSYKIQYSDSLFSDIIYKYQITSDTSIWLK